MGIDLAFSGDLCAVAMLAPPSDGCPRWRLRAFYWAAAESIPRRIKSDRAPYDDWCRAGHVFTTPGRVLDMELIARYIGQIYDAWRPRVCGYDPAWAAYLADELGGGATVVVQGGARLNTPSVHFEGLVETGQVDGCGNPCTGWQVQHAAADEDRLGRVRGQEIPVGPAVRRGGGRDQRAGRGAVVGLGAGRGGYRGVGSRRACHMESVQTSCGSCGCEATLDRWVTERQGADRERLRALYEEIDRESDLRRLEALQRGCVRRCGGDPHCACRPPEVRGSQLSMRTYRERTGRPGWRSCGPRSERGSRARSGPSSSAGSCSPSPVT